jgi:hypothetical protein
MSAQASAVPQAPAQTQAQTPAVSVKNDTSTAAYLAQLNPQEKKVLKIAMSHLETSFSLVKSIGYQEWKQQQTK